MEASHRKIIAECPEFTLYEEEQKTVIRHSSYKKFSRTGRTPKARVQTKETVKKVLIVESSPNVEHALWRSLLGINSRGNADARQRLAMALQDLMLHRAGNFTGDSADLLERLSDTLGEVLINAFNIGTATKPKAVSTALKQAIESLASANAQINRCRTLLPLPGDRSPGAWTWIIQYTAKSIFRETRKRPTKTQIREKLESEGWQFKGHNKEEDWYRVFQSAGLNNLPNKHLNPFNV